VDGLKLGCRKSSSPIPKFHPQMCNSNPAAIPLFPGYRVARYFYEVSMSILQPPINTEMMFEPLLTSREAAPFLRLHYKTLESMARAGVVPATKQGKSWVFRLSRLSDWINQQIDSKAAHRTGSKGSMEAVEVSRPPLAKRATPSRSIYCSGKKS
jgi:excisionase family DNA binding protein